jgi:hypothetical protein
MVADLLLGGGNRDLVARPTKGASWTKVKLPFEVPLFPGKIILYVAKVARLVPNIFGTGKKCDLIQCIDDTRYLVK